MSHAASDPALYALQQRFHEGDVAAFEALVSTHLDAVYTLCLRMLGAKERAEDVAQDAVARALLRHHLYRPGRPMRPWLLTIAANLCRNELRTAWWRRWNPLSGGEIAPTLVDTSDEDAMVRAALATLPPKYREALALYHLDDMNYAEMEEITGIAVPALKQRVRRGRLLLEEKLQEMYPELVSDRRTL